MLACRDTPPDAHTVRDSAGVRIVQNRRPTWTDKDAWHVDTAPLVDIGERDQLSQLGQTFRLNDGRIVVAHRGGSEILFYSPTGELTKRVGRRGSGPGEFREISSMVLGPHGDSIVVWDYSQNRLSVFDTAGMFVRSERGSPDGPIFIEGAFSDGSFLVFRGNPPTLDARGLTRTPRVLLRRTPDGQMRQVAEIPGMEMFYQTMPGGEVDFRPPFFGHLALPDGARPADLGRDRRVAAIGAPAPRQPPEGYDARARRARWRARTDR